MTNEPNIEFVDKVNAEKLTSLAKDAKKEQAEIIADREHWAQYGINRSTKAAKSKPTLESLLTDHQGITGKDLIKLDKEEKKHKAVLQEAIESEPGNRKQKQR